MQRKGGGGGRGEKGEQERRERERRGREKRYITGDDGIMTVPGMVAVIVHWLNLSAATSCVVLAPRKTNTMSPSSGNFCSKLTLITLPPCIKWETNNSKAHFLLVSIV